MSEPAAVLVGAFKPDPITIVHECCHVAMGRTVGFEMKRVTFDTFGDEWNGITGITDESRDALEGGYWDRLRISAVAYAPSVVIFKAVGCEKDMAIVQAMAPDGYTPALWEFLVEHKTRKLLASHEFRAAFEQADREIRAALDALPAVNAYRPRRERLRRSSA